MAFVDGVLGYFAAMGIAMLIIGGLYLAEYKVVPWIKYRRTYKWGENP